MSHEFDNDLVEKLLFFLKKALLVKVYNGLGYLYGYDIGNNKPLEPVYCEVAGYGLSLHTFLYLWLNKEQYEYIGGLLSFLDYSFSQNNSHVAPYGFYPSKNVWDELVYSFDNGVIVKGLLDAYKILNDKKILEKSLKVSEWLINNMQYDDGSFRAAYNYSRKAFVDFDKWYGSKGCLHGKLAMPFLFIWRLSGNERFRESSIKLVQWLLNLQLSNGAFRAKEKANYVFLHAHCYALEGLLYAWYFLGNDEYLDAIIRGAKWLSEVQYKGGGIPVLYPSSRLLKRVAIDATAQAIRIWLILYKITDNMYWFRRAEAGIKFLNKTSLKNKCKKGLLPAYTYIIGPITHNTCRLHTWSIMFAIQSLIMYENVEEMKLREIIERLF